eukprot:NODE_1114_length_1095_cov_40.400574_g859_i0.p1 GENE.NODE_1114_length_1095_cov_40.400574_g859_i0~~NODE_1114_length_1095_cov_40.400574_g859_i0.p1  ORF type:complete len:107 (+),score=18.33 NODE_1114_length_1095_cov_40.400574_g859_i0:97-417(+)
MSILTQQYGISRAAHPILLPLMQEAIRNNLPRMEGQTFESIAEAFNGIENFDTMSCKGTLRVTEVKPVLESIADRQKRYLLCVHTGVHSWDLTHVHHQENVVIPEV